MFDWYYVGRYGQLGPLNEEQMIELIESGVITAGTYVWKRGMTDWVYADSVPRFAPHLGPSTIPPPPPAVTTPAGALYPTNGPCFEIRDAIVLRQRIGGTRRSDKP